MFRRLTTSLILLLVLPAFAHAWYVNAKTSPATGQGTVSPSGNTYYAAGADSGEYTVTPAAGYKVARVTIDGVAATPNGSGNYTVPYLSTKSWRYLVAYFTVKTVNIATSVTGSGGIREDNGEALTNIPLGATRTLLIVPAAGYQIDTYSAANATSDLLDPNTGVRTVTYTDLQADQVISATFGSLPTATAYAGSDQTATGTGPANAATLSGTGSVSSGIAIYSWSGPAELLFVDPSSPSTQVWSDIPGVYTATLTVSNSDGASAADAVQVTVLSNAASQARLCTSCHADGKDSSAVGIYNLDGSGRSPHFAGQALRQAQYVAETSRPVLCFDCHDQTHDNAVEKEFAQSAHADVAGSAWMHYDWRAASRSACARCHAGTAFVARLGSENDGTNVYTAADASRPGETLACTTCHLDATSGVLRAADAFTLVTGTNSATLAFPPAGASNLCVRCHGGRETGDSIKNDPSTTGIRGFITPHYRAAAPVLFTGGGYQYAGQNYTLGFHKNVGIGNESGTGTAGPCVACHMGVQSAGHTWNVVSRNLDGSLAAVLSDACISCHGDMTAAKLAAAEENYNTALNSLKTALEAKGIYYAPAHPNFFTAPYAAGGANTAYTNWAGPYGFDKWKDVMGAAFNYSLLENEPGAFAHNRDYALKLIVDSIDFLNDGAVNGNASVN